MGSLDREVAQRRGRRKLDAMKRRAGQLRRRVVAMAVVGFAMLWTAVFVQMATGNDPALGTGATTARPAATKKRTAPAPERPEYRAAVPPPSEEDEEPTASEAVASEAERVEAERVEAEARELEELEAVSTRQS